jgi:hypothetical protein
MDNIVYSKDSDVIVLTPMSEDLIASIESLGFKVSQTRTKLGFQAIVEKDFFPWKGCFLKQKLVDDTDQWVFMLLDNRNCPNYSSELCKQAIHYLDEEDVLAICRMMLRLDSDGKLKSQTAHIA